MSKNVSKEIKKAVARAIDHNDYSELNALIKKNETKAPTQPPMLKVSDVLDSESKVEEPVMKKTELETMIDDGDMYISKIKTLKKDIDSGSLPAKLNETETVLLEIFKQLKAHPEQIHKLRKLMDYYLPTTVKLLESYSKFDDVDCPGDDIAKTKTEIETTIDSLNEALTELLNKMLQTDVFDAATDAQVLRTMLSKDGLSKSDFAGDK